MDKYLKNELIKDIGIERYNHSIRVMETAIKLAEFHGEDIEKARIAGLLHDCGKLMDKTKFLKSLYDFGIIQGNFQDYNLELLHGSLGVILSKTKYGIQDEEILKAINYHTTGKEDMSLLEKIIYIGDYIEPSRSFPGVEEIRKLAFEDIDRAMILALENTIAFVMEKGWIIHLDTVKARNFLIKSDNLE